ncbi:hypothetical protein [Streptococcus saliviloxodontae]|uniref:CPBP family intramembrane metalloprotease n=1 Tax=Streptococcus saliviloxodontae TaxID=1349416 RepID=A0ABS2PJA5_9STRE|nr:hypothetical protein [Streptococcus saliviloxodontae]MBM7635357.1 hypothetical protein [Streptococcus saliviloxodontae]
MKKVLLSIVYYAVTMLIGVLGLAIGLILALRTGLLPASMSLDLAPLNSLAGILGMVAYLVLLVCLRKFIKNVMADRIFDRQNVQLGNLATAILVLLAYGWRRDFY